MSPAAFGSASTGTIFILCCSSLDETNAGKVITQQFTTMASRRARVASWRENDGDDMMMVVVSDGDGTSQQLYNLGPITIKDRGWLNSFTAVMFSQYVSTCST